MSAEQEYWHRHNSWFDRTRNRPRRRLSGDAAPFPKGTEKQSMPAIGTRASRKFLAFVEALFAALNRNVITDRTNFPGCTLDDFRRIDATAYFGLADENTLISSHGLDRDGKPSFWPFDYGMIAHATDECRETQNVAAGLRRMRSVRIKDCRGKLRFFSQYIIRSDTLFISPEGALDTECIYLALVNQRWVHATLFDPTKAKTAPGAFGQSIEHVTTMVAIHMGLAALKEATWTVEIGREDGLSFIFDIVPEQAPYILRLRDIPDGAKRRAALKHWVESHWRTDWRDRAMEIYVRQHLRGAEQFKWDGWFCRLSPSPDDIRLNERLERDRGLMGDQARREKFIMPEKPRIRVPAIMGAPYYGELHIAGIGASGLASPAGLGSL